MGAPFFRICEMSHTQKREPLTRIEQAQLHHYSESMGELALAEAAGVTRLAISRGRLGERLNTPTRSKLRRFLSAGSLTA